MNWLKKLILALALTVLALPAGATSIPRNCGTSVTVNIGGGRLMTNNFYNKSLSPTGSVCLQSTPWGWNWNVPGDATSVKAYPSVIYGKKPWNATTIKGMPAKISSLHTLKVTLTASEDFLSGIYNTSFDIWIVSALPGNSGQIVAEVMVFLNSAGWADAGPQVAVHTLDGADYRLLALSSQTWQLYQFKAVNPVLSGTFDILKFINTLVADGYLTADQYIADVEFGNEIKYGSGATSLNGYTLIRN